MRGPISYADILRVKTALPDIPDQILADLTGTTLRPKPYLEDDAPDIQRLVGGKPSLDEQGRVTPDGEAKP